MVDPNPNSARPPKLPGQQRPTTPPIARPVSRTMGINKRLALTRMPVPKTPASIADRPPNQFLKLSSPPGSSPISPSPPPKLQPDPRHSSCSCLVSPQAWSWLHCISPSVLLCAARIFALCAGLIVRLPGLAGSPVSGLRPVQVQAFCLQPGRRVQFPMPRSFP